MKPRTAAEGKKTLFGWDIGGAHLKMARVEGGRVTQARTVKASMWLGLDEVREALGQLRPLFQGDASHVFTMTGELSDGFPSREAGIRQILDFIAEEFGRDDVWIYAGRSGFVALPHAYDLGADIASANWHATAELSAAITGDGLFVDMGSTTTDILAFRNGRLCNDGYSDAERLLTGELVYTGFTRSALIGIAERVPVRGTMTPLMNEYFANTADLGRILGTLDEADDHYPAADRRAKSLAGSIGRIARMVGRDSSDLDEGEWIDIARWFSEHQLRMIHDGAFRVAANAKLDRNAPVVGAGIGRPQIMQLAKRLERPYVDFGTLVEASSEAAGNEAGKAAPAAAVALLWSSRHIS
ncbi:putative H4MPT-linked C1 transfer pathway protein [Rhizobium azooxidifex]|uniref:Putative H4MPT-linked C1 transfer pathway protein n=1 Tax=Mycoplana azooxidifex TaxID=1636188 RepID=A0A7W6GJC3_9HYPH|nr:hydantoinase/oxoprolinase family protein [Mycoplana azooxidifex]MBB3977881.1 putative H4MPT-linked C1 transfer pathway protein [Mycoplana azooxidifex]